MNNIVFFGGIHGVGKSTICKDLCKNLDLEYLSASSLIKWEQINGGGNTKNVKDIIGAQRQLIQGLKNIVQEGKKYLLDGHYCLLNQNNQIEKVPLSTFQQINPISLNIILGDISIIQKRLQGRDNKLYKEELLQQFQEEELEYAIWLSRTLGITLNIGTQNEYLSLLKSLRSDLSN